MFVLLMMLYPFVQIPVMKSLKSLQHWMPLSSAMCVVTSMLRREGLRGSLEEGVW
jgi:hypothetical protein